MSVTVEDILKLPCLSGAKVAAGERGLGKVLSSVSVLEFADPNALQAELFQNNEFYGSEIVITAFANIADNVELQCANIRRLAAAGEVGLILYYVGIFLPRVDRRLIELANQLDFTLIVMPENRMDLRYSEVICEVMEAIIRDQASEISLVSDILDQMSRLPEHQRTVDAVLRMTRDRIRTSLILTDSQCRALGQANWPMSLELPLEKLPRPADMSPVQISHSRTLWRCPLEQKNPKTMELYLVKDGAPLGRDLVLQTVELVRLAVKLWSSRHEEIQISELVRAILRDEPLKMRRLADLFHIDVASIHSMWALRLEESQRSRFETEALAQMQEVLSPRCSTVIADIYEGYVVAFMAWRDKGENVLHLSNALLEQLEHTGISAILTRCHSLIDTGDVRRAFLLNHEYLDTVRDIWPFRQNYTLEEVEFVCRCRRIVDEGENALAKALRPLKGLDDYGDGPELQKTLVAYLLDAGSSVSRCGEQLFLHKNTIKYRLGRIGACLGYPVDKEPEKFYLYEAAVLKRLTEKYPNEPSLSKRTKKEG